MSLSRLPIPPSGPASRLPAGRDARHLIPRTVSVPRHGEDIDQDNEGLRRCVGADQEQVGVHDRLVAGRARPRHDGRARHPRHGRDPGVVRADDPEALGDHLVHDLVGAGADALQAGIAERAAHG